MVLDPIPQSLPVHFFGSRPQPPTSRPRRQRGKVTERCSRDGRTYTMRAGMATSCEFTISKSLVDSRAGCSVRTLVCVSVCEGMCVCERHRASMCVCFYLCLYFKCLYPWLLIHVPTCVCVWCLHGVYMCMCAVSTCVCVRCLHVYVCGVHCVVWDSMLSNASLVISLLSLPCRLPYPCYYHHPGGRPAGP